MHVAIQDPHLQVTVEPRVLRFSSKTYRTPQLVCVSAVDDTDKSSESVESTVLEHVTASADADFDRIRFEVPVSISDNDGHYLWGFGSNVYRQLGNDAVGPASILPAAITGSLDSKSQNRGGSKGESHSEKNKNSSISSDEGSNSDSKFDEEGGSSSRAVTLGTSPQAIRALRRKSANEQVLFRMPSKANQVCFLQVLPRADIQQSRRRRTATPRCTVEMMG